MSELRYPVVNVIVSPKKVSKGQMISIIANIVDRDTLEPMQFDTIYLEIIDDKGIPAWPLSLIEKDSASFSKLISTYEMQSGMKYLVRVSPSNKLSPKGTASFEIDDDIIDPLFLVPGAMLIPHLLLSFVDSTRKEKDESTVVQPHSQLKIAWLIYKTQLDAKVCNICSPNEGLRFRPDDPDLIKIGDKEHGGDTHYGCRCHYTVISKEEEIEIYEALTLLQMQNEQTANDAYHAYLAAKVFWNN